MDKNKVLSPIMLAVVSVLVVTITTTSLFIFYQNDLTIGSNHKEREELTVTGYVMVSQVREGNEIYHFESHNLITNAGKDFVSAQLGSLSPGANGANYIALSSDSTAPAATDTTLTGEISGSGLDRAQGDYSHTPGTNTFTVQEIFTASGSVNNIQKTGLFTASSGGTMMAENTFSSVNMISGDQLTITWTVTIG